MKSAQHIFEYLTAFAVVVLFSAVILFFPELGSGNPASEISNVDVPATVEQPAAAVTPETNADNQTNG